MRFLATIGAAFFAAVFGLALSVSAVRAGDLSEGANEAFLAANATKPGVVLRPSGLQYRVIKHGKGRTPTATDTVSVAYKGQLIDGTVFDQATPAHPLEYTMGKFIPGWVEALSLMKEGDEWELVIPSNLAYGEEGAGNVIPPNQTLIFDMQLLAVK